jgi:hypothetical protein
MAPTRILPASGKESPAATVAIRSAVSATIAAATHGRSRARGSAPPRSRSAQRQQVEQSAQRSSSAQPTSRGSSCSETPSLFAKDAATLEYASRSPEYSTVQSGLTRARVAERRHGPSGRSPEASRWGCEIAPLLPRHRQRSRALSVTVLRARAAVAVGPAPDLREHVSPGRLAPRLGFTTRISRFVRKLRRFLRSTRA